MFLPLNRKKDCVVKIKISLFIITKDNVSLITCDYVIVNLTKRSLYKLPNSYRNRRIEHRQTFNMERFAKR